MACSPWFSIRWGSEVDAVIEVKGLKAAYGERVILEGIDFSVSRGEIFAILGGSGSGKSTLLRNMIGLIDPAEGEVLIAGRDLVRGSEREREDILSRIGVTFQSGALFGSMTVLENVRLPLEEFTSLSRPAMDLIARMKLSLVGLLGAEGLLPSELSGGMQKRAGIARALALDPLILFFDEPSAGLDPVTSAELDRLILRLRDSLGVTVVLVTHELPSIYSIVDRVIMLSQRRVVAQGAPRELQKSAEDPWVRRFFNREAEN